MADLEPWIGLVHVQPALGTTPFGPGILGGYAHAVALAVNSEGFMSKVTTELAFYSLMPIEFDDVASVEDYESEGRISDEMADLIAELSASQEVRFRSFDTYDSHDS